MRFQIVGVIGSGVMGAGVAQDLAQTGHRVILIDLSDEILTQAKNNILQNIRFQKLYKNNDQMEDQKVVMERITLTTNYEQLKDASVVIENVSEKWNIKYEVYKKLDVSCAVDCIIAANTSCISITQLASLVKEPSRVIGTHFMNPVPLMASVECIRGSHTSEIVIDKTRELLREMNKEMILVNDYPGFVSNRISHLFMNEAAFVIQDQVAEPKEVDDIFKKCYGHKMGPLETADLIGLDTVVDSLDVLYESYKDPKFRCCPLLRKMVNSGRYGRKSGEGFYNYKL